jgi:hypothetical protein
MPIWFFFALFGAIGIPIAAGVIEHKIIDKKPPAAERQQAANNISDNEQNDQDAKADQP